MNDLSEGVSRPDHSASNRLMARLVLGIEGTCLLMTSCFTSLNFLAKEPGTLTRVVLRVLYQELGWRAWAVSILPIYFVATGR